MDRSQASRQILGITLGVIVVGLLMLAFLVTV
jgi:hypothetical protein